MRSEAQFLDSRRFEHPQMVWRDLVLQLDDETAVEQFNLEARMSARIEIGRLKEAGFSEIRINEESGSVSLEAGSILDSPAEGKLTLYARVDDQSSRTLSVELLSDNDHVEHEYPTEFLDEGVWTALEGIRFVAKDYRDQLPPL